MQTGISRYWLCQIFGWGVFALVNIFFAATLERFNQPFYTRLALFIVLGIFFTHLMRWMIHRTNLLLKPLHRQIPGFILLTFITAVIVAAVEIYLHRAVDLNGDKQSYSFFGQLLVNTFYSFVYLFIWSSIYFMYHYVSKSRKQQMDTLQLESMVKELELQTIKAHINPHFIFNSLNSIRALVDENPERARRAITELSNILRSSMQADKSESVPLQKELNIVKDYLALENMRFEDRLRIEYDIDDNTLVLPVPPMMLQTLVENAIKHGISKQIHGGVVRIVSVIRNNFHELSVQNTGYLNGSATSEPHQLVGAYPSGAVDDLLERGFGLSSTTNRLSLLYGNKAKFEIKQTAPSLVEARVQIPVELADY
jgi:two-component system, LytTR family, sensor kinase